MRLRSRWPVYAAAPFYQDVLINHREVESNVDLPALLPIRVEGQRRNRKSARRLSGYRDAFLLLCNRLFAAASGYRKQSSQSGGARLCSRTLW